MPEYDAGVLVAEKDVAEYFEVCVDLFDDAKLCANWIMGELARRLNDNSLTITDSQISPELLVGILKRITDNTISGNIAKKVFESMWQSGKDADAIIEEQGLKQVTDTGEIEKIVDEVIAANPGQVEEYRGGKDKLIGFFVGQVMQRSKGKANPGMVNDLLKKKL